MRRTVAVATLLALAASRGAPAAERAWTEVRSPHFQVLTDAGEKSGRDVALRFEQIRAAFAMLGSKLRLDPGQPLTVITARDERSLAQLLPSYFETKGRARPAGVFLPLPQRMFVVLREDLAEDDVSRHSVLFHEYVHLLHSLNFRTLPVWLAEGLAEFYAHTTVQTNRVLVGRPAHYHVALLRDRRLVPLAEFFALDRNSPHYNEADRVSMFYAQAWAVTHWLLLGDKGANRPRLQRFMDRMAEGATAAEAARDAFPPAEEFRSLLDNYLLKHAFYMQTLPALTLEPATFTTRAVTPGEIAGWRALLHLAFGRTDDARRDVAEALRLAPGAAIGHEANAHLLTREARLPEARGAAAAAIERDPGNVPALMLAGQLARMPGGQGPTEAVRLLERAVEVAPDHALALAALAEARSAAGAPAEETLDIARRAVSAWPASLIARFSLASQLSRHGEHARALAEAEQALALATTDEEKAAGRLVTETIKAASARQRTPPAASREETLARHRLGCDGGDAEACVSLGVMMETGPGKAADAAGAAAFYDKGCGAGSARGCYNLGLVRQYGRGGPKDLVGARGLFEKACAADHAGSCAQLAGLLRRGEGGAKDEARALDLDERACAAGHGAACTSSANAYATGRGRTSDPAKAVELYGRACEKDDAAGCHELGWSHADGDGVPRDLARAIELFDKACRTDAREGCVSLAEWLMTPDVGRDFKRAANALDRACQAGEQKGCATLAGLYAQGMGVAQDAARAESLARGACEKGTGEGCANLAVLLASDPARAVPYWEKACDGGVMRACTELALHHLGGRGVPQSMPKARTLFTKACDGGEGQACNSLADLTHYGDGAKDPARVAALRKKACLAGYQPACAR